MPKGAVSLAIDPGYDRVGMAVFEGSQLVHSECFSPPKGGVPERMMRVAAHMRTVIKKFKPTSLALETLFFSKNQKTAMHVAEVRGVITVAALELGLSIHEYSPQAVKIAVTGSGNASKDGVIRMVERLVVLPKTTKRLDDEYDAIALGIAHTARNPHLTDLHSK